MTTLYGNPVPPNFNDGEELSADAFNAVKNYWITDELPETAENGDVAFVIEGNPVPAGGKVLQVVSVRDSGSVDHSTTQPTATKLKAKIQPSSPTNRIIVSAFTTVLAANEATDAYLYLYKNNVPPDASAVQLGKYMHVNSLNTLNAIQTIVDTFVANTTDEFEVILAASASTGTVTTGYGAGTNQTMILMEVAE